MTERTVERAHGRWREILPALGVPAVFLSGKHQPCPLCGGRDRARFTDRFGDGDYFCSQCGAGQGIRFLMKFHKWDFATAAKRVDEIIGKVPIIPRAVPKSNPMPDRKSLRRLWADSEPATCDDPVGRYFAARHLEKIPPCIRYVAKMKHADGNYYPGMIAIFHGPDGKPFTLHRTYLTEDGHKADLESVRKFMPGQIAKGGAVRLNVADKKVGIAEGIETALSAASIFDMPCWAALNEGLLRAWLPPPEIKSVVIFGDHDENFVGQAAAFDLAKKLHQMKIAVEVRIPKLIGHDWNDALCEAVRD